MEQDKIYSSALDLIDAVRIIFEAELAKNSVAAPTLQRLLAELPKLRLDSERSEASQQSVCRHLSRALDLAEAGSAASVAKAFRQLEPMLHWRQNPRYSAENISTEFMDNYAYTTLGLTGGTTLSFGILLLGPGITYPLTSYPSEGVFLVIGGSPEWKCGDEPWVSVDTGCIVCRPPHGAEGKRPGKEPLLALYAWLPL
ncbi:dimethylsulfoniopropionate lyase [Gammaproteobacteria bacterium]|nr:dimethylsulfoniopropionate lyase [Gammaproteobacteria bacterium]